VGRKVKKSTDLKPRLSHENQMKRDIYCMSIHAELQPRTNMDGEGDAKQIKRYSETTDIELRELRKDL
jgi:hypothetical protein